MKTEQKKSEAKWQDKNCESCKKLLTEQDGYFGERGSSVIMCKECD